MRPLAVLRNVYSLDTLDSRITQDTQKARPRPSLSDPPQQTESLRSRQLRESSKPSQWRSPEYLLYYAILSVAIPLMFKSALELSRESHPNFPKFSPLLSKGWIPGRRVDNSDRQYANFRNNLYILLSVLSVHFVLRRVWDFLYTRISPTPPASSSYLPTHNINRRTIFDIGFALIFLTALHSLSVIKILWILGVNFCISYFHPSSILNPILTWGFNIGILFANEYFQGYRFRHILPWLIAGEGSGVGYAMDNLMRGGILPRWEISFNITVLRLISYNLDHYWAAKHAEQSAEELGEDTVLEVRGLPDETTDVEAAASDRLQSEERLRAEEELIRSLPPKKKKLADRASLSERDRTDLPAEMSDYGLFNYFAYILYTPLYLAGPILTFNDYVHQQRYPPASVTPARTLSYAIRFFLAVLSMELILHFIYVVAISKTASRGSWAGDTPFQLAMIGYFNLHIIWLKLLCPWRFFRLWALVDGVDPPENMLRCMSNNYSALAFWRSWHRSFNRWIVRYIYIPLGGGKRPFINFLAVFTFVALWHDLSLKLLTWGWLIVLFVMPELFLKKLVRAKKYEGRERTYRIISALGAVVNMMMMMAANLVGFAIGTDGLKEMVKGIFGHWGGVGFIAAAVVALFSAVQVMFEIREAEMRKGVDLRC